MKIYYGWGSTIVEQYNKFKDDVRPLLSYYHIQNGNWKKEFKKFIEIKKEQCQKSKDFLKQKNL